MKDKVNQLFRDKLILVTVVLGLVAIVAAAGTVSIRKGNNPLEESPYLEIQDPEGLIVGEYEHAQTIGNSNATEAAEVQIRENTLADEMQAVRQEPAAETEALEAGALAAAALTEARAIPTVT